MVELDHWLFGIGWNNHVFLKKALISNVVIYIDKCLNIEPCMYLEKKRQR